MSDGNGVTRGISDQIRRYRTAFTAVVVMIVIALLAGGYILDHERLTMPSWFPVVGSSTFPITAEFETAQALTPGQGQALTIAGVKIGEISSVELKQGVAHVSMAVDRKYAPYIYRNATMLVRPKTQLKDETIQMDPGTKSAGRIHEGEVFPLSQSAPEVNFEEFLNALDGETRIYLQELLAAASGALKEGNGRRLSAVFRRFDPLTRDLEKLTSELQKRHIYISRSIHNFQLLLTAIGHKDRQLAEVISASSKDFQVFAEEDQAVQQTLKELPQTLGKTKRGLGKLAGATEVLGPTLKKLMPFARYLGPAQEQSRKLFKQTTPVIQNEIVPFAKEVQPFLKKVPKATGKFDKALPGLTTTFSVFNEFFNELAYNPGPKQGGFLFFLDWANHDFNSALSTADAMGPTGRILLYFNCEIVGILKGAARINPDIALLVGLLNPPEGKECEENHIPLLGETASASSAAKASAAPGVAASATTTARSGHSGTPGSTAAPAPTVAGGSAGGEATGKSGTGEAAASSGSAPSRSESTGKAGAGNGWLPAGEIVSGLNRGRGAEGS